MPNSDQPSLFDDLDGPLPEDGDESAPTLTEWSYSRRETIERCPLWYYYQYYGASARQPKADPMKEILQFLKTLTNRHLRVGEITHLVIRTFLKYKRQGEDWPLDRVLRWARQLYRSDWEYSQRQSPGDKPASGNKSPALLMEYYYGLNDADTLLRESEAKLAAVLTTFMTHPALANFRTCGCYSDAWVEKPFYLKDRHFSLRGQIDLAYPDNGRVVVVDWKAANASGEEDSLQLLSYALVVMSKWHCAPGDIDLYRVHLGDGNVARFSIGEDDVQRAKARIIQDLERMRTLHNYGLNAVTEAFTPCRQPRICALCPFQALCPGKE